MQLGLFLGQSILLATDLHLFQTRQLTQAGVEDVVSLVVAEAETGHQHLLGLLLGADDVDHFIEVEEGDQQAVQQVQTALDFIQAVLQAAAYGADAEGQPLAQQGAQVLQLRLAVQADDVDVDPVGAFQLGGGEQVLHQLVGIDAVGARNDDNTARVLVVRLVAQVGDHRQLLGLHLRGDLLQHLGTGNLMRQRGDHDVAVLDAVHGAHAHRALAGFVDFQQVAARGDDLRLGRIIRAEHVFAELLDRGIRLIEQAHAGRGDFAQVVRRYVSSHAHGDAGGAIKKNIGQPRRQYGRLVQGAVEVRYPVGGALAQFGQQHLRVTRQARLGVTHGGERLGIIRRTPVTLAVDQGVAVAERLSHQHHGFVAGRVAVGVELTQHVTDGARGFFVLGVSVQAQLAHGVDDAPLHRLQAVADMRQGAVHDHVHGIVEVGLLGKVGQGAPLDAVQAQVQRIAHACLIA